MGQVARRFGPDGREACKAVIELEAVLAPFLKALPKGTRVIAVTESVTTPVSEPVFPNRILRSLGLLALKPASGGGLDVDLAAERGVRSGRPPDRSHLPERPAPGGHCGLGILGASRDGVDHVAPGSHRAALGLDHPRAGDVVLVSSPDRWFAPDWWKTPQEAPRQPELTSGLAALSAQGLLDPARVKGSLGAPAPNSEYHGVIVASDTHVLGALTRFSGARSPRSFCAPATSSHPPPAKRESPEREGECAASKLPLRCRLRHSQPIPPPLSA